LRLFVIFSSKIICLVVDFFLVLIFGIGDDARPCLVRRPTRPPGPVPGMQPGEDRARLFDRQLANGAISAVVNLLDHEGAPWDGSETGIELTCIFHFKSPS
jgi:hypothetical protein